jgi:tetratricopeptide (TPR) repeat protein
VRFLRLVSAAGLATALYGAPAIALASPASEELRARASDHLYNMDRDRAVALYREAVAADPNDAAAHRGLASALWLSIAFLRGSMTVDNFLGRMSRSDVRLPQAPPAVAVEFRRATDRAIGLARSRLATHPMDPAAHYELGAAVGLRASYNATIDGSIRTAFGAAREAFNAHERVLELTPARKDAGLIVGTYRYLVAMLSMPLRVFAYAAGFGGGRNTGIRLVEGAAAYPGDNQTDARLALILLYNREQRYDDALEQFAMLQAEYPRNRLLWLESGATSLRAGRFLEAERTLTAGIGRLAEDARPRMFGEEALWYYKRGAARAAMGRTADAEQDLRRSISLEGRRWVHGRARLELGKLALRAGNRHGAASELRQAAALCEGDNDQASADEARRLMR